VPGLLRAWLLAKARPMGRFAVPCRPLGMAIIPVPCRPMARQSRNTSKFSQVFIIFNFSQVFIFNRSQLNYQLS
jgi:hypothetical protein